MRTRGNLNTVDWAGLYQHLPDSIPEGDWGRGMVTLAGDAAHTATVDGTGM
jgi:2-polyprenyl-6-methoxyphenol hydroxylase-like FAD-dependent oxidoreductase